MSTKIKTLKLSYPHLDPKATVPGSADNFGYLIVGVGDTVEFYPGQFLPPSEVKHLCDSNRWKITIVGAR